MSAIDLARRIETGDDGVGPGRNPYLPDMPNAGKISWYFHFNPLFFSTRRHFKEYFHG